MLGNESQTKTKSSRTVPLTPLVLAMLERRKFLGHDFVFATRDGHILARHNVLRAMCQQNGHTIHELRHTYITRAARAGINPRVLQSISGHRTLSVLLNVYTHVSEDDKESASEKITNSIITSNRN